MGVDPSDAELFEKHADELTRFATAIVGPADAQDVVSSALLRCVVSRNWSRVVDRRAYLYRAVLNEARSIRRSTHRRLRREQRSAREEAVSADGADPEVLNAVMRLSPRQRSVIVLTYWNDLRPADIASLLGITEGSVRRHLARARGKLKEVLDDHS